jgi:triacylglycerol esterase/lipase EstA (alpha/beta hydrolase family)
MSGLKIRPTLTSFFTLFTTAFFAVFLFALPAQAAEGEAYLIVPDMVLGNVEGTEEVFSSLYTELEKQGIPTENISNFRYDPYDGITTITEELDAELNRLTTETGDTEISVLGYGVGGLIVRNYLETELYTDNIESLIFAATPHEGTIAYTEHIYGKNISYLNAWERLYWEGKDVPMLMKQVLPTNLPLVGVSLEDEALTPLREAVAYSIIEDLKNREQDAESPIKNLTVTNLRPSGYFDGWYFTPKQIRTPYSTTNIRYRQISLASGVILEMERGIGDGYVTKSGASFPNGTTREYWAEHTDFLHQGIRDVISGLGLNSSNVDTYHNGRWWYEHRSGPYPKSYQAVAFKTDVTEELELIDIDTSGIQNVERYEEEGRVILFGTEKPRGQVEAKIDSHARQDIYLTTFLANARQHINYKTDTFTSEVGEKFTFELDLNPYCSTQNWQTSCSLLSNDSYPYNVWQETSREWIQYPIVLVHGILGSFNADMLKPTQGDDPTMASIYDFGITGLNPTNDIISSSLGEKWFTLPVDESWNRLKSTMEIAGLQQNVDYFQFSYDWRHPNQTSAYNLRNYINRVQALTGAKKVSVVAHSMGGLVTRAYIEDMANPSVRYSGSNTFEDVSQRVDYENNIARFIMAGTPNMGSGTAIPRWYGGDTLSGNAVPEGLANDYMMQYYLGLIQEDYIESNQTDNPVAGLYLQEQVPATRDLLPTYETTMMKKSFEPTLLNPNNFVESWLPRITDNVFLDALNAKSHSEDSSLNEIDTLSIAGVGQETVRSVHFIDTITPSNRLGHLWSNWFIESEGETLWFDFIRKNLNGDETVLDISALSINNIQNEEIILPPDIKHGSLYQQEEFIANTLEKVFPNYQEQISERIIQEYQNALTVNMYSPADIEVILSDGTIVSPYMDENEMRERGIFYLSQGESQNKMLYIPNVSEGEYEVLVKGNGTGAYTLHVQYSELDNSIVYDRIEGETIDGKEESYNFSIEKDDEDNISEEAITLTPSNTPPTTLLDNDLYEGVEGSQITFDGSSSTDEDGDTLQYQWIITDDEGNEIISTEFSENSSYTYTFEDPFTGTVTLIVTDGEFESSVSSQIIIRELSYEEKVSQIRELIQTLEEDTSYMRSKKRLWMQLVSFLELPQVEKSDRLQSIVARILEKDIERSLLIDNQLERTWMWWRRINLISEKNENVLQDIVQRITQI